MKTTFGRQFGLTAALILLCVAFLGAGFRALMYNYLVNDKRSSLSNAAESVSSLAAAYNTSGELAGNWDFRMSLNFASKVAETDTVICDEDGKVIVCSCDNPQCVHMGRSAGDTLTENVLGSGETYAHGSLSGIYDDEVSRYYVAAPIIPEGATDAIGFVIVSSPGAGIDDALLSTLKIFLLSAIVVLLIALAASSIVARHEAQQLRSLADTAQRFGHGDLKARAAVNEDNTVEMNELAREFNNMAISLEQAELRRREFVANVSHELKTPMTTIAGYMDGMLDGTIPSESYRKYMQTVSDEVRRLSRLVRSMLDISRLQSQGVPENKKTKFDLCETVGSVLVTFEQKITARHIDVEADLPEDPVPVWADPDSITQVVYNLTDNAVKFCPDGGKLWVRVTVEGGKARAIVGNTGKTIPPDELPLLFDRFHKVDKSRSEDREGYGLGLYIVKTIIDGHGEDISAASENGRTEFTFTLPLKK